jgi:polysaccharide export outer membrane protein
LFRRAQIAGGGALLAGLLLTGCESSNPQAPAGNPAGSVPAAVTEAERFGIGDLVIVNFSGVEPEIPAHEQRIKEDGNITLYLIGSIQAAGKTPGELQNEIQKNYVPKYYVHMTVTVRTKERVYYVRGEVKRPDRYIYSGETTVTRAIATAGDFTDYANKRKVKLTRVDGKILKVDCIKAQDDPRLDLPVFPGDQIQVMRRLW